MLDAFIIEEIKRREKEREREEEDRPSIHIPAPEPMCPPTHQSEEEKPQRGVVIIDYSV